MIFLVQLLLWVQQMGGDQSKPQEAPRQIEDSGNPEDDNYFFVDEPTKVTLRSRRQVSYYWIDPRVYNAENQKYFNQFLQFFKIESFTSIEGLKGELDQIQNQELIKVVTAASLADDDYRYLQEEKKVAEVFLFCGNEERAKLLQRNFKKITGFGFKCPQVIEILKQAEAKDNLQLPPASLLCMIEEDRKVLNKYRLNYYSITSKHQKDRSKVDFLNIAKALCPEDAANIERFEAGYNIGLGDEQTYSQALQWAFENNFYFKLINELPKATTDPKKLAYLRLPFSDLWQAIFHKHKEIVKAPEALYIVVQLSEQQIQNLDQILDNFIIFTSFIKGFTKKADAIKQAKQNGKSFIFQVLFTKNPKQKQLDFGFIISEDKTLKKNVIFNIYNFFKVEEIDVKKGQGTLIYGSLAQAFYNRADETSKKRVTDKETMLLRNYDYLEYLIEPDKSQAVVLKMHGYFRESLEVYEKKVEYLKRNNASASEISKYQILRGDAYRLNEEFEEAEREYKSLPDENYRLVGLVHLLELYLKKGDDKAAQKVQEELETSSNMRKLKEKFIEAYFKAENYFGLSLMKQDKIKEAVKKFKNLQGESSQHYRHRFQGIPIVHDIFRNMATCQAKLSNHKQALNLLNSTKDWQLVCEGESAGVALTETMIRNVYSELGNSGGVKQTEDYIQKRYETINIAEQKYLNQSLVSVSLGLNAPKSIMQSSVSINMNGQTAINNSVVSVQVKNSPAFSYLNQSGIQINLSQQKPKEPVNINNSAINIDL